jgi:hypothetical protein
MSRARAVLLIIAVAVTASGAVAVRALDDPEPVARDLERASAVELAPLPEDVRKPTTTTTLPTTTVPPTTAPPTTAPPPVPPAAISVVLAGGRPMPGGDVPTLADQIIQTERIIRDPNAPADWVVAAGRLQQIAYRQLGEHPEWDAAVDALLPPELVQAATWQRQARREFRSMVRRLSSTLPAWRIVDPLPADELLGYYREAEAQFGVPWNVLAAVNLVETGMGRIVGLSSAGAQGPMQFMPATWARYGLGGDVWNPRDAIMGAANYLAANGGNQGTLDGLNNALFHYNNDDRYVRAVLDYASIMGQDPLTYRGFHAWQIVYISAMGDIILPTGYEQLESIPVTEYLASHPQ